MYNVEHRAESLTFFGLDVAYSEWITSITVRTQTSRNVIDYIARG